MEYTVTLVWYNITIPTNHTTYEYLFIQFYRVRWPYYYVYKKTICFFSISGKMLLIYRINKKIWKMTMSLYMSKAFLESPVGTWVRLPPHTICLSYEATSDEKAKTEDACHSRCSTIKFHSLFTCHKRWTKVRLLHPFTYNNDVTIWMRYFRVGR